MSNPLISRISQDSIHSLRNISPPQVKQSFILGKINKAYIHPTSDGFQVLFHEGNGPISNTALLALGASGSGDIRYFQTQGGARNYLQNIGFDKDHVLVVKSD